jgi:uroporphyrinogen-III synthase
VIYKARAVASLSDEALDALRNGRVDAAFHFSRRSASIFCNLISAAGLANEARALLHVGISTDAADGLRALLPPRLRVAEAPDEAHMIERLG